MITTSNKLETFTAITAEKLLRKVNNLSKNKYTMDVLTFKETGIVTHEQATVKFIKENYEQLVVCVSNPHEAMVFFNGILFGLNEG